MGMEIGTVLLMLGLAYGLGILWYDLLPGKLPEQGWRTAVYPFAGMFAAEALLAPLAPLVPFDPAFWGLHLITVLVGSVTGVMIDWAINAARHPAMVRYLEPRAA